MNHRALLALGVVLFATAACADDLPTAAVAPTGPSFALGLPNGATADTLYPGETVQLSEKLPRKRGKTTATATVWSSSDTKVATVTQAGLVTAVAAGSAVVTASNELASERATMLVVAKPSAPAPTEPAPTQPAPVGSGSIAEAPRAYVNTDPVPVTGATITVRAGADLQAAINAARPGDAIVLEAGATFTGNFVLPAKSGDAWITITTSAASSLPAFGQRATPAHAVAMPKLVTPNASPALATSGAAHHYRIVGLEITAAPSVTWAYSLVALGATGSAQSSLSQVPHDLVVERSYVHGHSGLNFQRCVALNSASTAIVDSWLSQCHGKPHDSQAIGGWNGPGPYKIVNNHLAGAGENVMFGGSDPSIANLVPSDIEIRRNHFHKPLAWKGVWTVKNVFELKNARRVLVEGNVFENNWVDEQNGFAILMFSVNQGGTAPWSVTSDVNFRYNHVRNTVHAINLPSPVNGAQPSARLVFEHNLLERIGAESDFASGGRLVQASAVDGLVVRHTTGFGGPGLFLYGAKLSSLVMENNILGYGSGTVASADGMGVGTSALNAHAATWTVRGNVLVQAPSSSYPAENRFPASLSEVGFVSPSTGDWRLAPGSLGATAGVGGVAAGADAAAVRNATAGVVIP